MNPHPGEPLTLALPTPAGLSEFGGLSDEDLAATSQGGSLAAFEELVSRYERRLYMFALHSVCDPGSAREIAQETFVKAFQALAQFDTSRSFRAWLFAIARRRCIDHFRSGRPLPDEAMPELAVSDDPSSLLSSREERQCLWEKARLLLPDIQYQALWLRYAEEMSVRQIAEVLHKSRTHVKVLLFRARQSLGRELRPSGRASVLATATSPAKASRASRLGEAVSNPVGVGGLAGLALAGRRGVL